MIKRKRIIGLCVVSMLLMCGTVQAQYTPWFYWTLIAQEHMDEIIGEASGDTAWNTIMETEIIISKKKGMLPRTPGAIKV